MSHPHRLLEPHLLPETLYNKSTKTLSLPPKLASAYAALIQRYELSTLAAERDFRNPPTGGHSQAHTDQHFAQAFGSSAGRAQLAVTDPMNNVGRVSNAFIHALSGNSLCITDAPCGTGAATFAFLSCIAELRSHNVLPRLPLDIHLIGAELSVPARIYAQAMLEEISPFLESQGIFVNAEFTHWDVLDQMANKDLITKMVLTSKPLCNHLLIVANFNDFLKAHEKKARNQLEELFRFTSGKGAVAVWIEPQMNAVLAKGGIFSTIRNLINSWSKFMHINIEGDSTDDVLTSEGILMCPINSSHQYPVRLAVMRLDLAGRG